MDITHALLQELLDELRSLREIQEETLEVIKETVDNMEEYD